MNKNKDSLLDLLVGKENADLYFLPSFASIVIVVLLVFWADSRRKKRGEEFNKNGLCALCGKPLGESYELIPISGAKLFWSGLTCNLCASSEKLRDRILSTFLAALAVLFILFLVWLALK